MKSIRYDAARSIAMINNKIFILSIIFLCAGCCSNAKELADYDTPTKREQKAIDRGNLIIYALGAYYKDNGVYPESLEDLTPVYLDKIPRPGLSDGLNFRTKFQYIKWPKSFRINFRYDMFSEFYYESSEGKWRYENH
ncbi:hypothetical protein [Treponema socranskii]|uniref:hypothetical protein n=1 Tax=Treponema socranskii TaxID=53419 RepID=UPI003D9270B2